jgi:hypothetical protein
LNNKKDMEKQNITKLTSIRELKRQSIKRTYNKAYNVQKSHGKTKKNVKMIRQISDKNDEEQLQSLKTKTKKREIILND